VIGDRERGQAGGHNACPPAPGAALTATPLLLIVCSSLLHAGWNLIAKRMSAAGGAPAVWAYSLVTVAIYLPALLVIAPGEVAALVQANGTLALAVLASALLHTAYAVLLQRGYRSGDLSVVYPVARGAAPLLTTCGAVLLLGERPGPAALAGALLVAAGAFWLGGGRAMLSAATRRPGVGWGLLIATFIAAYTVVDAWAVAGLAVGALLLDTAGNLLRLAILTPVALRAPASLRLLWTRYRWHVLAIGAISPLSYILFLLALKHAPVHASAPARELSLLFGALLGTLVLREGRPLERMSGAALIAAGVALLARG
jgi:drug/metabolite transporter (DMT)-like permease